MRETTRKELDMFMEYPSNYPVDENVKFGGGTVWKSGKYMTAAYEKANEVEWEFQISCPECGQAIIKGITMEHFDFKKGQGFDRDHIQTRLACHILNYHPDAKYDPGKYV